MVELSFSNSTQLEHFKVSEFTSYNLRISIFLLISGFFFLLVGVSFAFIFVFLPDELLILFSIFFFYLTINI